MSRAAYSVAMTEQLAGVARAHLLRRDRQEDLCFRLMASEHGPQQDVPLSFTSLCFPRKMSGTCTETPVLSPRISRGRWRKLHANGAGLALMHSHPRGRGWQGMSLDDVRAEQGHAGAVFGATGKPFVGLTIAGDGSWSGRFWMRTAPRTYARHNCATVRVVGNRLKVTYLDELAPPPVATAEQVRTVSAWGAGGPA